MTLKNQYLLLVLGFLLLLKFVWVPVQEWQSESILEIELKTKQLNKMRLMLGASDQISEADAKTQALLEEAKSAIPTTSNVEEFKLSMQQIVEAFAKDKGLRVQRYSWSPSNQAMQGVIKEILELRLSGSMQDLIAFQNEIEMQNQLINTEHLNINVTKSKSGKPSRFRGVVRIGFYAEVQS